MQLEPVEIAIVQRCAFKRKPRHPETGKKQLGCARCGLPKNHEDHFGLPPSLNVLGSGNPRVYQWFKRDWEAVLHRKLEESGLPRGLGRVVVEGICCFPNAKERDEGNLRFMLEKALGDVLVEGGWLPSDSFFPSRRYSFGNLEGRLTPGEASTRLLIFPFADSAASAA